MNRRALIGALAKLPLAAPLAGNLAQKLAHEQAVGQLAKLANPTGKEATATNLAPPAMGPGAELSKSQWALALRNKLFYDEVRALQFEMNRDVYKLDTDIATPRAISLAAKICYQRQRNVDHAIAAMQTDNPWVRMQGLPRIMLDKLGLKLW